jgi:hypothetical protein
MRAWSVIVLGVDALRQFGFGVRDREVRLAARHGRAFELLALRRRTRVVRASNVTAVWAGRSYVVSNIMSTS